MHDTNLPTRLLSLMQTGFTADADSSMAPWLSGIAHPSSDAGKPGWVASRVLLAQREALSTDNEWVLALLALQTEWREPWLRIVVARCREAGQMPGESLLVDLITQLRGAARWVEEQLPYALLAPTPTATLERELLGVSAEQSASMPMLTRILAVGFSLHEAQAKTLAALPTVDQTGVQAGQSWLSGRLLALPGKRAGREFVLVGAGENASEANPMAWVLANPWALLVAMVAYAQDAWAAESRGGLLLELPTGQNAFQPSAITVLVCGSETEETRCGTLAGLLLRVLGFLELHCFPRLPSEAELDTQIAPLVGQMLQHHVWRYRDGASGSHGQYQIHPEFADECYKIAGSKVFSRNGKHLWQAVRIQAEQWRSELRPVRQVPPWF
ncbi:MAG: hypothetical protein WCI11_19330 [Candidatus Methylumidiphilus sp.]